MKDAELEALLRPILDLYSQIRNRLTTECCLTLLILYETIGGTIEWYSG